jgi:hypothetical protein
VLKITSDIGFNYYHVRFIVNHIFQQTETDTKYSFSPSVGLFSDCKQKKEEMSLVAIDRMKKTKRFLNLEKDFSYSIFGSFE